MSEPLTEADAPAKTSPERLNNILNAGVGLLIAAVLLLGGYFGFSVWAERQAALTATPALRLIQDLKDQVRMHPNESALRVRLGEALVGAGQYSQAIEQFENALKIEENHTGAIMDLGLVAMIQEDYAAARRYFFRVVELTEGQTFAEISNRRDTALFNLGRIELAEGNYEEAVGFFKGSLRIRRDASDTYYFLARAYNGMGEPDAALEQLEISTAFDPNFAQAHFLRGEIYYARQDMVNAAAALFRAVQLAPDADPPAEALASLGTPGEWETRARTALADGDIDEAIEASLVSWNLDPTRPEGFLIRGEALEAKGDEAAALSIYEAGLEAVPDDESLSQAIERLKSE